MAAQISFGRAPTYERWAEGQPQTYSDIAKFLSEYEAARARLGSDVVESKHASRERLVSV